MSKVLRGNEIIKKPLVRVKTAAGFIREAMKATLSRDKNFSLLEKLGNYTTTEKSLFVNGYWLGRDKSHMPTRDSDIYTEVTWTFNGKEYVLNLEMTPDNLENKFFPVFNDSYGGVLSMEKDANGEYVLYEFNGALFNTFEDINNESLQQIFYGAPGTGKSHKIKDNAIVKNADDKNLVFRTTFHPDSDYSTFVGAYKPTMKPVADKYKAVAGKDEEITYSFVPQAFLQAYIAAWNNHEESVFLIIEEINRGNCAQIFGDLFQLLDRDDEGFSEYPIMADNDLKKYLNGKDEYGHDVLTNKDGIKDNKLNLPKNLYIWATMNTSDQSLFPIDSAFKRRWDWEYMPIGYKNDNWIIKIGDKEYKWVAFQRKINDKIYSVDNSEDKKLGDYFVNADRTDNKISADTLLNKILFYLWNDVCKDDPDQIFRWKDDQDNNKENSIKFSEFFCEKNEKIRRLQGFMSFLGIDAISDGEGNVEQNDDNTAGNDDVVNS